MVIKCESNLPASTPVTPKIQEVHQANAIVGQGFVDIKQTKALNILTKVGSRKLKVDMLTMQASVEIGDVVIYIQNPYKQADQGDQNNQTIKLGALTFRLLDALIQEFTKQGASTQTIELSLKDYMRICNLKDIKTARAGVKEQLEILLKLSMEWTDKVDGKLQKFPKTELCNYADLKSGIIQFELTQTFFDYLKKANIMPYPEQLYRIDFKKHPNSYYFLRRITEHKNMNFRKSNGDIIAVKTLLDSTPEIAVYEDIAEEGNIRRRIITVFERDMDYLKETLSWAYRHRGDKLLPDKDLEDMSYGLFKTLMVKSAWRQYPERKKK